MNFFLTPEQESIQDVAKQFAQTHFWPQAQEWDDKEFFPVEVMRQAATLGFAGLFAQESYGGCNLTRFEGALIFESLARGCAATAAYLSIHNMVVGMIQKYGNKSQQQQWLPKLTSLECFSSYCLTEPGAGSDAANLQTIAVREGDVYVINGTKAFISGGGVSDLYLCMVRTGGPGTKGISAIIVEKGTPGLSFGKPEKKMGWRSQPTTMLMFDNCRVPLTNLLGGGDEGFKIAMKGLDGGRINIAACSLGGAAKCLELSLAYVKERRQFGKSLAEMQSVQFKLADMATELDAARLMVYRAAHSLSQQRNEATTHCAMAKKFATDACFKIVNEALQLHGGYGYIKDYQIERFVRDLRVHQILEGTNEIMKLIISRNL